MWVRCPISLCVIWLCVVAGADQDVLLGAPHAGSATVSADAGWLLGSIIMRANLGIFQDRGRGSTCSGLKCSLQADHWQTAGKAGGPCHNCMDTVEQTANTALIKMSLPLT